MTALRKQLYYKTRFNKLYMKYDTGQLSWNDYVVRLKALNKRYE